MNALLYIAVVAHIALGFDPIVYAQSTEQLAEIQQDQHKLQQMSSACAHEKAAGHFPVSCMKSLRQKALEVESSQAWQKLWGDLLQKCSQLAHQYQDNSEIRTLLGMKEIQGACRMALIQQLEDLAYIKNHSQ